MPVPYNVICLAGPTGAGKTALSLAIANRFPCEIINADSRQAYRDFPIITAQPTPDEQARLPHHLYGFLPSETKISAGQWVNMAAAKIRDITQRGKIPLLVGGTGFYFEALLTGLAPMPEVPQTITLEYEKQIKRDGPEALHAALTVVDPRYAAKVHPHDRQRIQRAMEIFTATGKNFSWWHDQGRLAAVAKGPLLMLDVKLPDLAHRLKTRIDSMLELGAIAEAKSAWDRCGNACAPGWSGIGCREILAYVNKQMSLNECKDLWYANTRAYAKRQLTWFRGRQATVFINDLDSALTVIRQFIEPDGLGTPL